MSPLEIWCNEAQERYVLAVAAESLPLLEALCERERCPYAVLGEATEDAQLVVDDAHFGQTRRSTMPLEVLLGKPPSMLRDVKRMPREGRRARAALELREAVAPACSGCRRSPTRRS